MSEEKTIRRSEKSNPRLYNINDSWADIKDQLEREKLEKQEEDKSSK